MLLFVQGSGRAPTPIGLRESLRSTPQRASRSIDLFLQRSRSWPTDTALRVADMELGHWVTGSMGHLGHLSRPGHRVIILTGLRPEFFRFSKKCQKCKTYIWNAKMTKVIVRCLLLDWNHWMSVHAMNLYFYLWLLKSSLAWEYFFTHKWTFGVHCRTGSTGQLGLRAAGFPGHWVAGSQNVTPVPSLTCRPITIGCILGTSWDRKKEINFFLCASFSMLDWNWWFFFT